MGKKRISVYDYGNHYWIFTTNGLDTAIDMAETAKDAAHVVRKRLLEPLNTMSEWDEENEDKEEDNYMTGQGCVKCGSKNNTKRIILSVQHNQLGDVPTYETGYACDTCRRLIEYGRSKE